MLTVRLFFYKINLDAKGETVHRIKNIKEFKHYIYDQGYRGVDRHGIPGQGTQTLYDPNFDQGYVALDRHGIGAVDFPDTERFGTENREIQEFCRNMIEAINIKPKGYEKIAMLEDVAVKSIIQSRYIKTINKMESGYYDDDLEKQIKVDLDLIFQMIQVGRDLYQHDMNLSNQLGGSNLQNIIGVLEEYETRIYASSIESKMRLLAIASRIKELAIEQANNFSAPKR